MDSRARAHIHNIIRGKDRVFVMLNNQNGVAKVTQTFKGFKQAVIIALMQADGRFIKNVKNASQA